MSALVEVAGGPDANARKRMRKLVGRCELYFGSNIKSAKAVWTPNSDCEFAVALEKWDGTTRVVPERELERLFAGGAA